MRKPDRKRLSIVACSHEPDFWERCLGRTALPGDDGQKQKFLAEMAANDALLKDKQARGPPKPNWLGLAEVQAED